MTELYDLIGKTYDTTRKADPEIIQTNAELLVKCLFSKCNESLHKTDAIDG